MLDLLAGSEQLATALKEATSGAKWLDAFLLSAGLLQLVEDRLHPDPFQLRRGAAYLRSHGGSWARWAAAAMGAVATMLDLVRRPFTGRRRLALGRETVMQLTLALAERMQHPDPARADDQRLRSSAEQVEGSASMLEGDVVRLPACFRSFDQHPEDVRWLTRALIEREGRLCEPVVVVGVRTSGCYLAPLFREALRAAGAASVDVLTYRPGRPFDRRERDVLRATARAGGRVVVTDDPPGTGSTLAATVEAVAAALVPRERITLLLSIFSEEAELPPMLRGCPAVLQPWSAMSIHRRLDPASVGEALESMLPTPSRVDRCLRIDENGSRPGRAHAGGRYAVDVTDLVSGHQHRLHLAVEGAGLGYFGRHALAVGEALDGKVPKIYGFCDGLLYRELLVDLRDRNVAASSEVVAGYVARRRRVLSTSADPTSRMRGRDPVWEVAAEVLARLYGPVSAAARPYLLEPVTRRLLEHSHSSVVDGNTGPDRWLPDPVRQGRWVKVDFHRGGFSHLELACYDAAFDLAGAVGDPPSADRARGLRAAYRRKTGEVVDGERWLLYRLSLLRRSAKTRELDAAAVARRSADAVHEYLGDSLLGDLRLGDGPLCAIDLDGVLETDRLGYPATGTAGAIALRGLVAHGYRPVLATGRSLTDARDRCTTFGLAGAVAEYGTVVYDHAQGETADLRSPCERDLIDRVRDDLRRRGSEVDPGHEYTVRVRTCRGPLSADIEDAVPLVRDPRLQIVHGQAQSDITIRRLNKAAGIRALEERLAAPPCVFAVGDSVSDLPMLMTAPLARAPRNADVDVRKSGIKITRGAYQKGLLEACADLLGHRPGRCPVCAVPTLPHRTRELLGVLALPEAGTAGLPLRTARLAFLAVAGSWRRGSQVK